MARCGCAATCSCAIFDGLGTTVSGNGSVQNPYRVDVVPDPACTNVSVSEDGVCVEPTVVGVEDTDTINLELSGDGTPEDPYAISGDVRLDPDGGLQESPQGLGVCISDEPENGLSIDGDGCLYVSSAPGSIAVEDTNSINFDEADAAIGVVSADVRTGCGLRVDSTGVRVDTVRNWPLPQLGGGNYPCADTQGAPVYCDSSGRLRTIPDVDTTLTSGAFNIPTNPTVNAVIQIGNATFSNPSNCRPMSVFLVWDGGFSRLDTGVNGEIQYDFLTSTNGGAFGVSSTRLAARSQTARVTSAGNFSGFTQIVNVAPGASTNLAWAVRWRSVVAAGNSAVGGSIAFRAIRVTV